MNNILKKSPYKQDPITAPLKHKRRKRDDTTNRNYTCGCGKSYLSYPALYTHLKQKHDGKQPLGTILPSSMRGRKPRPQKDGTQNSSIMNKDDNKSEDTNSNEDKLDDVLGLLGQMSSFLKGTMGKPIKFLMEEDENPLDPVKDFPIGYFKNQQDFSVIYKYLMKLEEDPLCFEVPNDRDNGLKSLCINKILALFLFKIAKFLNQKTFSEIAVFLIIIRKTLNSIGWKLKNSENNNHANNIQNGNNKEEFCENNVGEYILQVANELITTFMPDFLKDDLKENYEGFVLLGVSEEKMKNAIYLTQYFGNWLFNNHYTNLKLDINYE